MAANYLSVVNNLIEALRELEPKKKHITRLYQLMYEANMRIQKK